MNRKRATKNGTAKEVAPLMSKAKSSGAPVAGRANHRVRVAEGIASVRRFRDDLMRWIDERESVGRWEHWRHEDGSCHFVFRTSHADGDDPAVRIVIGFDDM
jgi:hypothetical protein